MKRLFNLTKGILLLLTLGISQMGCTNEPILEFQEASLKTSVSDNSSANRANRLHFNASLKGSNEVPSVDTNAVGEVIVTISKDETWIHFKLIVANIQANITGSHFHMAPAGANAGVVVNLLSISDFTPPTTAPVNGVLAEGTITESNLSGALAGKPLSDLISAIRSGNIYVNVHTTVNPGGEIRGQL
jgi:hypothetical protein